MLEEKADTLVGEDLWSWDGCAVCYGGLYVPSIKTIEYCANSPAVPEFLPIWRSRTIKDLVVDICFCLCDRMSVSLAGDALPRHI